MVWSARLSTPIQFMSHTMKYSLGGDFDQMLCYLFKRTYIVGTVLHPHTCLTIRSLSNFRYPSLLPPRWSSRWSSQYRHRPLPSSWAMDSPITSLLSPTRWLSAKRNSQATLQTEASAALELVSSSPLLSTQSVGRCSSLTTTIKAL